eukprot:9868531-Ditylum_brightwellii.AAC.1
MASILESYDHFLNVLMDERPDTKPFKWNPIFRRKTKLTDILVGIIAEKFDAMDIRELNTLYYAAALTICGPVPEKSEKVRAKLEPAWVENLN